MQELAPTSPRVGPVLQYLRDRPTPNREISMKKINSYAVCPFRVLAAFVASLGFAWNRLKRFVASLNGFALVALVGDRQL